jgi:hypothetical protein
VRVIAYESSYSFQLRAFAGGGIACATIINFVGLDKAQRQKSEHAQRGRGKKIAFFAK